VDKYSEIIINLKEFAEIVSHKTSSNSPQGNILYNYSTEPKPGVDIAIILVDIP
jgi:hypothetical protein